jgi:hypothetical protein
MGPGLRPYVHRDYPMWIYLAGRSDDGAITIVDRKQVESDQDAANHFSRHWAATPGDALAILEHDDREIAKLAANRAYNELRMSDKAKAEVAALEAVTSGHLPNVPETPIKRRMGRPPKKRADVTE